MRVLMVHNEYQFAGGEDESTRVEEETLQRYGVEVRKFRVSNNEIGAAAGISTAINAIWSRKTYQDVRALLKESPCDVVHVQNFFPLVSPSVYYAAIAGGAAVVQTLRNYRLLCPNALFFREGRVCEDCLGKTVPWPAIAHKCYRNSAAASAAVCAMLTTHRALGTWAKRVDVFVVLTEFAKQKFVSGGLPAEKIVVKPNFAFALQGSERKEKEDYFLFVGRLSPEKGIATLLNGWRRVVGRSLLKVVGTGPLVTQDVRHAAETRVEFVGEQPATEVVRLMERARCLVFPSEVYEGMPRTIIEAFAAGLPVIASRLGAMAEIVEDGVTGLHFEPGNAADLAAKVEWACGHPEEMQRMGHAARAEYEAKYTPERNYRMLMEIYERAIASRH